MWHYAIHFRHNVAKELEYLVDNLALKSPSSTPQLLEMGPEHFPFVDPAAFKNQTRPFSFNSDANSCPLLSRYQKQFPNSFELMYAGGVHPLRDRALFDPYCERLNTENWRNTGYHSLCVALGTEIILTALASAGHIQSDFIQKGVECALEHDVGRRVAEFRFRAVRNSELLSPNQGCFVGPTLEKHWGNKLLTHLFEYDNPSGGENLWKFFFVKSDVEVGSLADKLQALAMDGLSAESSELLIRLVVRTVDDMTFSEIPHDSDTTNNYFCTAWERLRLCEDRIWYSSIFKNGYYLDTYSKNPKICFTEDATLLSSGQLFIASIAELQVYTANQTCRLLQQLLTPEPHLIQNPEYFISNYLHQSASDFV